MKLDPCRRLPRIAHFTRPVPASAHHSRTTSSTDHSDQRSPECQPFHLWHCYPSYTCACPALGWTECHRAQDRAPCDHTIIMMVHHSVLTIGHGHHVSQSTDRQKCPLLPQAWFRRGSAKLAAESQDLPLWFWLAYDSATSTPRSLLPNHWSAGPFSVRSTRPFAQIRLGSLKSSPCH